MTDLLITGAGIVGLAVAREAKRRDPSLRIVVLDKEPGVARHQTGHNSGVIHSGIYYKPGSLKARLGRDGNPSMAAYCAEHGIPHSICGKIIVATREDELERLEALAVRAGENGVPVTRISESEARKIEPEVRCLAALHVPSTGVVDYRRVCEALASELTSAGVEVRLGCRVEAIETSGGAKRIRTTAGSWSSRPGLNPGEPATMPGKRNGFAGSTTLEAGSLINCGGLQSDRIARLDGVNPRARIVPFRGDYWELRAERRHLVSGLIYPVPNPLFPFLGVHLTRGIDGSVHAGPNAVLSFAREGYSKIAFEARDAFGMALDPAFWKMAGRYAAQGVREYARSASHRALVRDLQAMIPAISAEDLEPSTSGVRAQAVDDAGRLIDDFHFVEGPRSLHVINAPSPAATAALEIAKVIVDKWQSAL